MSDNSVADLSALYRQYNKYLNVIDANNDLIKLLKENLSDFEFQMHAYDYKRPEVVMAATDMFIKEETEKKEQETISALESQIAYFSRNDERLRRNYRKLSSWFIGRNGPDKIVKNSKPYIYTNDSSKKISSYPFITKGIWGWVLGAPPLFIVFGPAYLAYKLIKKILDIFIDFPIIDTLVSVAVALVAFYYWMIALSMGLAWLNSKLTLVAILLIVTVLGLLCVYALFQLIYSHIAMRQDADKFLGLFYPDQYRENGYRSIMSEFQKKTDGWRTDIEKYQNGVKTQISEKIVADLQRDFEESQANAQKTSDKIKAAEKELAEQNALLQQLDARIEEVQKSISQPIQDVHYNNCVMTDKFCLVKDNYSVITHLVKPMLWFYDSTDTDEIQRQVAVFIADMYAGLIFANHFGIIDYCLIDYDTGGGLLTHDNDARRLLDVNMLNVIHDNRKRDEFYRTLQKQKERIIGSGGTGDIATINPMRIKDGDVPFKYHVVIHFGKEARNISGDLLQLYKSSSKFGFLPIFIMSKAEMDSFFDEQGALSSSFEKDNVFKISY
ncbi:MAG: hypothetical protein IJ757_00870 [Clostridiales bacterium]|nr:hypothetical protein [Clostridiales bacterium]